MTITKSCLFFFSVFLCSCAVPSPSALCSLLKEGILAVRHIYGYKLTRTQLEQIIISEGNYNELSSALLGNPVTQFCCYCNQSKLRKLSHALELSEYFFKFTFIGMKVKWPFNYKSWYFYSHCLKIPEKKTRI